jgi:hypothetical protein
LDIASATVQLATRGKEGMKPVQIVLDTAESFDSRSGAVGLPNGNGSIQGHNR